MCHKLHLAGSYLTFDYVCWILGTICRCSVWHIFYMRSSLIFIRTCYFEISLWRVKQTAMSTNKDVQSWCTTTTKCEVMYLTSDKSCPYLVLVWTQTTVLKFMFQIYTTVQNLEVFFSKDTINWSKLTVKIFVTEYFYLKKAVILNYRNKLHIKHNTNRKRVF